MASFQTPNGKALEFYARTVASGLNGGGRMASAMEVFDYGGAPEEESAILRIYRNSAGKSFNLEDSDRFSTVDEGTKERAVRKMLAMLRKNKIKGGTGETWVVRE